MNKYQEALDYLKNGNLFGELSNVALDSIEELVDKEIPKKPTISYSIIGEENSYCPNCVSRFSRTVAYARVAYKHCPECGQAIDWSENE